MTVAPPPSTKTYIIVLDGAGDRPNAELDGRTPLDRASTTHLDSIARRSQMARVDVIGSGFWPESDSGAMAILSYDPLEHYTGRGPLEGLGAGMIVPDGRSIAFRANFGSLDPIAGTLDRRTARGLSDPELQTLADAIRTDVTLTDLGPFTISIQAFNRHRAILGIRSDGPTLNGRVTNTDPGFENVGVFGVPVAAFEPRLQRSEAIDPDDPAARLAAQLVNAVSDRAAEVLIRSEVNAARARAGELPANVLLIRDGGDPPLPLPGFAARHDRSVRMFGQIFAEKGLAELIGGSFEFSNPDPGETEASYLERAAAAVLASPEDVVFIHLKGPDEPGHDNLPFDKVAAIEAIDRHFVGPFLEGAPSDATVIVCCDHATPCGLGIHSDDPVPVMVARSGQPPDGRARFTEAEAELGSLALERMADLLPTVFSQSA